MINNILKKFLISFVVCALVVSMSFNVQTAQAVSSTFTQTDWNGGQTTNIADDTNNQTGWDRYSAKDANITTVNGGADIELTNPASVTNINFNTEGEYVQENATHGTDFAGGSVQLHNNTAYDTLNPNKKDSDVSLSNGNMTVTEEISGLSWTMGTTTGKSSGKYYVEFSIGGTSPVYPYVGLVKAGYDYTAFTRDITGNSFYASWSGNIYPQNIAYGAAYAPGNVIGVAVDLDNHTVKFSKNNIWYASKSINAGTYHLAIGDGATAYKSTVTLRTDPAQMSYIPPAGYTAGWSTNSFQTLLLHADDYSVASGDYTLTSHTTSPLAVGKFNNAFAFNGTSDYIDLSGPISLPQEFTVDFWIKPSAVGNTSAFMIGNYYGGYSFGWDYYSGGEIFYTVPNSTGATSLFGSVSLGVWSHIAIAFDNGTVTYYVNGVSQGTADWSGLDVSNFEGMHVGAGDSYTSTFAPYYYFNGNVDEFRITPYNVWTSNFTPPTSPYSNSTTSYYVTTATGSQINTSTYAAINNITTTQTTPTNTNIKYLASFDNRVTWKYWNG